MRAGQLLVESQLWDAVRHHLFSTSGGEFEEAAFLFCEPIVEEDVTNFSVKHSWMLSPSEFACRSRYYLELSDETRQCLIKRAHTSNLCLVEIHSHPGQVEAKFSVSDLSGFQEFVPHIRWRLAGRPYAAIVFGETSFDSIVWVDSNEPTGWCSILVDNKFEKAPTKSSFQELKRRQEDDF